jgi:3-deoxy-manno-octulosonate cytidylyltransferase (CMP-KDO synthetase)
LKHTFWKHIGIYGYTNKALQAIQSLQPSQLEECEKLEQLRWLENGLRIYVGETNYQSFSVDTHEDYLKALALWEKNKHA